MKWKLIKTINLSGEPFVNSIPLGKNKIVETYSPMVLEKMREALGVTFSAEDLAGKKRELLEELKKDAQMGPFQKQWFEFIIQSIDMTVIVKRREASDLNAEQIVSRLAIHLGLKQQCPPAAVYFEMQGKEGCLIQEKIEGLAEDEDQDNIPDRLSSDQLKLGPAQRMILLQLLCEEFDGSARNLNVVEPGVLGAFDRKGSRFLDTQLVRVGHNERKEYHLPIKSLYARFQELFKSTLSPEDLNEIEEGLQGFMASGMDLGLDKTMLDVLRKNIMRIQDKLEKPLGEIFETLYPVNYRLLTHLWTKPFKKDRMSNSAFYPTYIGASLEELLVRSLFNAQVKRKDMQSLTWDLVDLLSQHKPFSVENPYKMYTDLLDAYGVLAHKNDSTLGIRERANVSKRIVKVFDEHLSSVPEIETVDAVY